MHPVATHDARTSNRFARLFQHQGVCFGSGKDRADDFQAFLHGGVRTPSRNGSYGRVLRIFI